MRTREVAAIGLKILAVYVFFQFLMLLPTGLGTLQMRDSRHEPQFALMALWLFMLVEVAYLAFALILFFGAQRLSRSLVQNAEEQISLSGPVASDILTMAFRCLGVYAIVTWVPNLIQTLVRTIIYGTWYPEQVPVLRRFYDNWSGLVSPTIGSLLGLLLIFKAKGLLRLIQLSRPMAREQPGEQK